jgi:hypothetical protein
MNRWVKLRSLQIWNQGKGGNSTTKWKHYALLSVMNTPHNELSQLLEGTMKPTRQHFYDPTVLFYPYLIFHLHLKRKKNKRKHYPL